MPFIPHTEGEVKQMLQAVNLPLLHALFAEIPDNLRAKPFQHIPEGRNEQALWRLFLDRAKKIRKAYALLEQVLMNILFQH